MSVFQIKKGKDINLAGKAAKEIEAIALPPKVALRPSDFRGFRPRVLVAPDDLVKVGTPVLEDKDHPEIKIASPVSGKVAAVNRGEKRVLLDVVIVPDGKQEALPFKSYPAERTETLARHEIIEHLLSGGVWPCIRQRPFSRIANPRQTPKAVFVQGMNTEPLAIDVDVILQGREKEFQAGLDILAKLTKGGLHLCVSPQAQSRALLQSKRVSFHQFYGPHPAGNVSTHIHHVDPINKGDLVWYVRAEDVLRVAHLFLRGAFSPERFVAVTGVGADNRNYKKTVIGAPVAHLLRKTPSSGLRVISGSILAGTDVGPEGHVGFYDSQITVLPRGGQRELLGWLWPGFSKYSFSRTFASVLKGNREVSLDTDKHGSDRAIVLNHVYDQYVPLDIMTYFLIKAVLAGDIEEAERLGILECDEEDFALCTFACPSKVDVGGIIRSGLDVIEKDELGSAH